MKSNIKIRLIWIVVISITLLYVSCSRKETVKQTTQSDSNSSDMLSIIERYYKMQNTKTEGTFTFQSNVTNNDPQQTKTVLKGGFFNDTQGKYETDGGDVSIGGEVLTNKNGWYGFNKVGSQTGMYGTHVTFSINPPVNQGGTGPTGNKQTQSSPSLQGNATPLTTTLYSPQPITITNIPPKTPVKLTPNTNTTLTWNADPLDSNGVVIIADYLPTRIFNYYTNKAGYNHALTSSELVPDNGSTTVPWSFFSQFPVGSHITLWVARGNYTILSNKDYSYKVGGYTAAAVWDVTVPGQALINNASSYSFSSTTTSGSGTITGIPGTTVTVTVSARAKVNPCSVSFQLSGASFTSNSSGASTTNLTVNSSVANTSATATATFVMPSSGTVNWSGTGNVGAGSSGGGKGGTSAPGTASISVQ